MTASTFSDRSADYARARPTYPPVLYDWIRQRRKHAGTAWDCATGNGQAATELARLFDHVIATDISEQQVAAAASRPNVTYRVEPAESTSIPAQSVDAVTVAQALHWFDFGRFWAEVTRVCRPGALFFAWGYDWMTVSPTVDEGFTVPLRKVLDPFWAPNNQILWRGYQPVEVRFPFAPLDVPEMAIELDWTADQLADYVRTWSAFKKCAASPDGYGLTETIVGRLPTLIPIRETVRVRMPIRTLAGFVE